METIAGFAQNNYIEVMATILLMIFIKFFPKDKIMAILNPLGIFIGLTIDLLLIKWLPKKQAEKIEEGFFFTLIDCLGQFLYSIKNKMAENNAKRIKNEKKVNKPMVGNA